MLLLLGALFLWRARASYGNIRQRGNEKFESNKSTKSKNPLVAKIESVRLARVRYRLVRCTRQRRVLFTPPLEKVHDSTCIKLSFQAQSKACSFQFRVGNGSGTPTSRDMADARHFWRPHVLEERGPACVGSVLGDTGHTRDQALL